MRLKISNAARADIRAAASWWRANRPLLGLCLNQDQSPFEFTVEHERCTTTMIYAHLRSAPGVEARPKWTEQPSDG